MELRIPPVLLTMITAALMWLVAKITSPAPLTDHLKIIVTALFATTAAVIGIAGVVAFRKANTTVNPLNPNDCSSLVETGVFRLSRNPMYLALLTALTGWGLFLGSPWTLVLAVLFVLYMNRYQIRPEEQALEAAFGEKFLQYKRRVRRWI
jgi:protein-S-isoprenylcysteine O-methyltransferase Ste14